MDVVFNVGCDGANGVMLLPTQCDGANGAANAAVADEGAGSSAALSRPDVRVRCAVVSRVAGVLLPQRLAVRRSVVSRVGGVLLPPGLAVRRFVVDTPHTGGGGGSRADVGVAFIAGCDGANGAANAAVADEGAESSDAPSRPDARVEVSGLVQRWRTRRALGGLRSWLAAARWASNLTGGGPALGFVDTAGGGRLPPPQSRNTVQSEAH